MNRTAERFFRSSKSAWMIEVEGLVRRIGIQALLADQGEEVE